MGEHVQQNTQVSHYSYLTSSRCLVVSKKIRPGTGAAGCIVCTTGVRSVESNEAGLAALSACGRHTAHLFRNSREDVYTLCSTLSYLPSNSPAPPTTQLLKINLSQCFNSLYTPQFSSAVLEVRLIHVGTVLDRCLCTYTSM